MTGICFLGLLLSGGCQKTNPLDDAVDAASDLKFNMWKGDVATDFTYQEWHDFDDAVQEIKFNLMAEGRASGAEEVRDAALQRIDGKPVRQVLAIGLGLKLTRLQEERKKIGGFLELNKKMRTREGDEDGARYLQNLREEQTRRLERIDRQIEETNEIIKRRGLSAPINPESKSPEPHAQAPGPR